MSTKLNCSKYWYVSLKIKLNISYLHYLHFSDYCPHLCRHVYHNVSDVVSSGLLQVVGMSNWAFISLTGVDCSTSTSHVLWMSVISYLLLISPLKVLHCLHRVLNSHSFLSMSLDLNYAFIHCTKCCDKHGEKDEENSPKNVSNVHNSSSQKYRQISYLFTPS